MSRTRFWTATAVISTALVALTACGRAEPVETPEPASTASATEPTEGASEDPITGAIQIWALGAEADNLHQLEAGFAAEYPGTSLDVTALPWDGANDKIRNAIVAGVTPDIVMIGTTDVPMFASTGGIEPVPAGLLEESGYFPGSWSSTFLGDTQYTAPWYADSQIFFYRKDLADAANATVPTSVEELVTFATALQGQGARWGTFLPSAKGQISGLIWPFLWAEGGDITDAAGAEFTLDTPQFQAAVASYNSFFERGLSPLSEVDGDDVAARFVNGEIGSFVSGPWQVANLVDIGGEDFRDKIGIAQIPMGGVATMGGGNLGVFTTAPNKSAAWKFIEYVSRPEVQVEWFKIVGGLPTQLAAWESDALSGDPTLDVYSATLENARPEPPVTTWAEASAAVYSQLERLFLGEIDAAQAASAAQKDASAVGLGD